MATPLVDSNCSKCDEIRFRNKGIYNLHENALRLKIIEMAAMKSEMQCAENKHRKVLEELEDLKIEKEALKIMKENAEKGLMDKLGAARSELSTAYQEIQALQSHIEERGEEICKTRGTIHHQLKKIAQKFKKQKDSKDKKVVVLEEEKLKMEKRFERQKMLFRGQVKSYCNYCRGSTP